MRDKKLVVLECLFREINILTECRHPNIIKILDASFDGTIIKEQRGMPSSANGGGDTDRAEHPSSSVFGSQQQATSGQASSLAQA